MLYQQIEANKRKTFLLVLLFCSIVMGIGGAVGLLVGEVYFGLVFSLVLLAFYIPTTYMSATGQVLRMAGAQEIKKQDNPELFNIIEELIIPARLPMPKVYIVNDEAPNAFATGIKPEKSVVGFTTGLLKRLNREELEGVVAHELAHIRNYDIRLTTICIALVSVIAIIGNYGVRMLFYGGGRRNQKTHPLMFILAILFIILAPIAAHFVNMAVSRNREYLADATAVDFTRNPQGLINALTKISSYPNDVKHANGATASMYISRPIGKAKGKIRRLLSTHPPTADRIQRLYEM